MLGSVGEFLDSLGRHEGVLVVRLAGPGGRVKLELVGRELEKQHKAFVEAGGAVVDDSEGEEERKHQLSTEDLSRAGVSIVEGSFEHGHEFNVVGVDVLRLNDLVLVLLPEELYEGGDRIRSSFDDVQYDLRDRVEWATRSTKTRGDVPHA